MSNSHDKEKYLPDSLNRIYTNGDENLVRHGYLYPVEEANDFHDPFSELSLFLAKRLKQKILKDNHPKRWSENIQKTLLAEVLPEFRKHFPHYRLGISALKKTWEKIHYYVKHLENHYAYNSDGKLDISYLIRQNLTTFFDKTKPATHGSFHFAHHITGKISECIATIDGESIEKSKLTKIVWAMQKQLISNVDKSSSPYESIDTVDKLLIRFQLEIITENPLISQQELQDALLLKVKGLLSINRIRNFRELSPHISSLIAEKIYPSLSIHTLIEKGSMKAIEEFIKEEYYKLSNPNKKITAALQIAFCKQFLFTLRLKETLPREEALKGLKSAIEYVFSLRSSEFNLGRPVIRKEIYHFINGEIILAEKSGIHNIKGHIIQNLMSLYDRMQVLPKFPLEKIQDVEIVIWKNIKQTVSQTLKIPSYLTETIENEIASIYLDNSTLPFSRLVEVSIKHLKRISQISTEDLTDKAHYWSIQNLTIASHLKFSEKHPIFLLMLKEIEKVSDLNPPLYQIIENTTTRFLKKHPGLSPWKSSIEKRVSIYYQYYFFSFSKKDEETPFDRFIKWHLHKMSHDRQGLFKEFYLSELSAICRSLLPYIPFIESYVKSIIDMQELQVDQYHLL